MNKKQRKRLYFFRSLFTFRYSLPASERPLDVVIPVVPKDMRTLPLCIEGVRRCVTNEVKDIYIVSPANQEIELFCADNDLKFVEERSVLGYGAENIHYMVKGVNNRSGWIFQQLLKLSGKFGTCEEYVVIDADHVLLCPHTFVTEDHRYVFYQNREYHEPYYRANRLLTGNDRVPPLSYVAHKMVFSKRLLADLRALIAQRCDCSWDQAILKHLDPDELSCFSEYELYAGFVPDALKRTLPWRNRTLHSSQFALYDDLVRRYGRHSRVVTFPDYLNH